MFLFLMRYKKNITYFQLFQFISDALSSIRVTDTVHIAWNRTIICGHGMLPIEVSFWLRSSMSTFYRRRGALNTG